MLMVMVMAAMMMAGYTNAVKQQKETIPTEDSLVTTCDEEPAEEPEEEYTVEPIASQMLTDEDVKKGLDFWARTTWSSQLYNEPKARPKVYTT